MSALETAAFRPLYLADSPSPIGHLPLAAAALLVDHGLLAEGTGRLALAADGDLSDRLEEARALLARQGLIGPLRGEAMPVRPSLDGAPIAHIDRSALRIFGFWASKIHINGLVPVPGSPYPRVWLSRRSSRAKAAPGAFDTLVAGGQAHGASKADTVRHEAWEEAGLRADQLKTLSHRGDLPIQYVTEQGFHQELLVIYDLVLDAHFTPVCTDGEIESSVLLAWPEMVAALSGGHAFKFGSRLVCEDLVSRLSSRG